MMIKNVVFDFGGVFVDLDGERSKEAFRALGVNDIDAYLDPYLQRGLFRDLENGSVGAGDFVRALGGMAGRELSYESVRDAWLAFIVGVDQEKLRFAASLRDNRRVFLLSNTNPFVMDWADTPAFSPDGLPLSAYFDKTYRSCDIGLTKPDPRIFEFMLEDGGMVPEETLFVDDGPANVAAARDMGLRAYLAVNGEDWRADVSALLR